MFLRSVFLLIVFQTVNSDYTSNICGNDICPMPRGCPKIISREEWGARKAKEVYYAIIPVNYTIIHHTATPDCNSVGQCKEMLRNIQDDHMEKDFGDIGYNFMIGGDGNVYEGCGWHRIGAHLRGYNSISIGIAFIGNYQNKYPSEKQLDAAKDLIQCSFELGELFSDYKVVGARQLQSTLSPGAKLFNEIRTWPHWSETA